MGTVEAFARDMELQVPMLRSFRGPAPLPAARLGGTVFCGSGDSLAAAMLAVPFSGGLARAMDPRDFVSGVRDPAGCRICVVSVSGRTAAGIRAARAAGHATAVTAARSGGLVRAADRTIHMDAPSHGVFTAGSASFLESALCCISLVQRISVPDPAPLFARARRDAAGVGAGGRVHILGDAFTFPVAMYGAAKLYELVGGDARYCRTEQFSHMELFCARRGDAVLLLEPDAAYARRLGRALEGAGLRVARPPMPRGRLQQAVYCTFLVQHVALAEARRRGRRDCHFVTSRAARDASSSMIYQTRGSTRPRFNR